MNKTSKSLVCLAALMALAAALILPALENALAAPGEQLVATYSTGTLHVTIPFHGLRAGAGQLTVEVLDPEDAVLGRSERRVENMAGTGSWREDIQLAKPPSVDDLVWHRVRYRFHYADQKDAALQGTESISEILRTPVVHILGQQSYLTGGPAAVRVIVTDSKNEAIAGPGSVRIDLMAPGAAILACSSPGRLNRRGTTEAQFRFPAGVAGSYPLRYVVDTPIGSTEFTQQVRLEDKGVDSADHGEADLPARPDHPRARAGARSRQSRGDGEPQADVRSGGFARQQGLQEGHADRRSSASRRRSSAWPTKSTWAPIICAR